MHASLVFTLAAGLLLTPQASADTPSEQTPLTGQMAEPPPPAAPSPPRAPTPPAAPTAPATALPAPAAPARPQALSNPASPPRARAPAVGTSTRQLLQLQASGSHAGPHRPMLGDQAAAAYKRYLDSFAHPIPEFFRTTIQDAESTD